MTTGDENTQSEAQAIDLELKKVQLMREQLALHDELRKRQRRAAVHDGVVNAAEGLGRAVGRGLDAMDRKTAQWEAEKQQRAVVAQERERQRRIEAENTRIIEQQRQAVRDWRNRWWHRGWGVLVLSFLGSVWMGWLTSKENHDAAWAFVVFYFPLSLGLVGFITLALLGPIFTKFADWLKRPRTRH